VQEGAELVVIIRYPGSKPVSNNCVALKTQSQANIDNNRKREKNRHKKVIKKERKKERKGGERKKESLEGKGGGAGGFCYETSLKYLIPLKQWSYFHGPPKWTPRFLVHHTPQLLCSSYTNHFLGRCL